jgi:hypothetical protein
MLRGYAGRDTPRSYESVQTEPTGYASGILYFVLLVVLGVRTFQNKHYFLFALGFVIPVIWIVGAMLPPKGMSHVDELYARRGETD